jgi:hypothetical protein
VVLLAPAYLGYGGGNAGWFAEMQAAGAAALRAYGRYLGRRFGARDNVIWLNGGDYTPDRDGMRLVTAVAQGIRDTAPHQLHTAHWGPETSTLDVPEGGPALDLDTTYTYRPVYVKSLQDAARNPGRPRILVESAYESDIKDTTPRLLRGQAYYALLTGAAGQVYGHGDVWQFTGLWRQALASTGSCGAVHVWDLFSALPWTTLVPDRDARLLVAAPGRSGTADAAVAAISRDRGIAVAYLPTPGRVTLDPTALSGPVQARLYDPANGTWQPVPGWPPSPTSAPVTFTPPPVNAAGDGDWILVVDAVRAAPDGAARGPL